MTALKRQSPGSVGWAGRRSAGRSNKRIRMRSDWSSNQAARSGSAIALGRRRSMPTGLGGVHGWFGGAMPALSCCLSTLLFSVGRSYRVPSSAPACMASSYLPNQRHVSVEPKISAPATMTPSSVSSAPAMMAPS